MHFVEETWWSLVGRGLCLQALDRDIQAITVRLSIGTKLLGRKQRRCCQGLGAVLDSLHIL